MNIQKVKKQNNKLQIKTNKKMIKIKMFKFKIN